MITKKEEKDDNTFICEMCDFSCGKKFNYEKHLSTRKHINNDISLHKKGEIEQNKKYKIKNKKDLATFYIVYI